MCVIFYTLVKIAILSSYIAILWIHVYFYPL